MITRPAVRVLLCRAASTQPFTTIADRCCASKTFPGSNAALSRSRTRALVAQYSPRTQETSRAFSSTTDNRAQNRVYNSVRSADELSSYILSSTSSRTPLLTLWTASYCPSCRVIEPLLSSLIENGVGEAEGSVAYVEVEFDAPGVLDSGLGMTYMINSLPTLLSFDRGEVVQRITDVEKMRDRTWLTDHIENEARRRGEGTSGGGGSPGSGFFGGLFGNTRR